MSSQRSNPPAFDLSHDSPASTAFDLSEDAPSTSGAPSAAPDAPEPEPAAVEPEAVAPPAARAAFDLSADDPASEPDDRAADVDDGASLEPTASAGDSAPTDVAPEVAPEVPGCRVLRTAPPDVRGRRDPVDLDARRLLRDLQRLHKKASALNLPLVVARIDDDIRRLREDRFTVGIVGEYLRGKTTLVNALLGDALLPTEGVGAPISLLHHVSYASQPAATLLFDSGEERTLSALSTPDALAAWISSHDVDAAELSTDAPAAAAPVRVSLRYPADICRNNVDFLDTPGLNDDPRMMEMTLGALPQVDAAILVVSAWSPFSDAERSFLSEHLLAGDLSRVLFVVTGIDRLNSPADADRIVGHIGQRIQKLVLDRAAEQFGADSDEYHACAEKIGTPRVFGVDAYHALEARRQGDIDGLHATRLPALEAALAGFLGQERRGAFLSARVGRVLWAADEISAALSVGLSEAAVAPAPVRSLFRGSTLRAAANGAYREAASEFVDAALQTARTIQKEVLAALAAASGSGAQPADDLKAMRTNLQAIIARAERLDAALEAALESKSPPPSLETVAQHGSPESSTFTADEWRTLQFAPLWMFRLIARRGGKLADPKERAALSAELDHPEAYPMLAREVFCSVADDPALEARFAVETGDCYESLEEVRRLLDTRVGPEDAAAFKVSLLLLGRRIAESAAASWLEASFSVAERELLMRAGAALGLPMKTPSDTQKNVTDSEWSDLQRATLALWIDDTGDRAAAFARAGSTLRALDTAGLPALARELLESVKRLLAQTGAQSPKQGFIDDPRSAAELWQSIAEPLNRAGSVDEAAALRMSLLWTLREGAAPEDIPKELVRMAAGPLGLPMHATTMRMVTPAPPSATQESETAVPETPEDAAAPSPTVFDL